MQKVFIADGENRSCPSQNVVQLDANRSQNDGLALPTVTFFPKQDIALLLFSSGTTDLPKGVMLTHFNLTASIQILENHFLPTSLNRHWPQVVILPIFHAYGICTLLSCLVAGCPLTIMSRFSIDKFLSILRDQKIQHVFAVPYILKRITSDPRVRNYDISCLKAITSATSPLHEETYMKLRKLFPHVTAIKQAFGMTEVMGSHVNPVFPGSERKRSSIGMLLPCYEAKVVDISTGAELGCKKHGEICLKTPTACAGYYQNQEATSVLFDKEGWLHTGDIGYYDEEEFFYIVGRLKELIKVKGFQVSPTELEDIILKHPLVVDVAVIGIPDEINGELPFAYVVRKDASLTEEMLAYYFNPKVIRYKRIMPSNIRFVASIPKTKLGKPRRKALLETYISEQKSRIFLKSRI
ncbi:unnamed protein product [Soboliphyme baturini]|uniref:AMP-binding domain-containing protein n=1 Tax=Soboliphyme baturini TaxID=241478 RepID=A0A183IFG8_9BILA|nr:unnamed protein product [Soboliphyme baturini]